MNVAGPDGGRKPVHLEVQHVVIKKAAQIAPETPKVNSRLFNGGVEQIIVLTQTQGGITLTKATGTDIIAESLKENQLDVCFI